MGKTNSKKYGKDNRKAAQNIGSNNHKSSGKRNGNKSIVCDPMPNNPSWYANNPQLLKDVASLPFSNTLGTPIGLNAVPELNRVPGVMRIGYAHSLGCGHESTDAPTVAARFLYTYVRHANSGSANYEAPDLYLMIMAWHSANAFLTQAKRAYGAMMHYLPKNKFFAETVVEAMGFNYESLQHNLPQFRAAINLYAARLNSIKVPSEMPIGFRWNQLASEYYVDGTSTKAQIYVPTLSEILMYDGYGTETGTSLLPIGPSDSVDLDEFVAIMDMILRPLVSEEDVGIMSGDIQKAFGDKVSTVSQISEDYVSLPIASDEMTMQIHNLIIPGEHYLEITQPRVYQEEGVIKEEFRVVTRLANGNPNLTFMVTGDNLLLDTKLDSATPEDVITMTRFIPGVLEGNTISHPMGYGYKLLRHTGSEIVTNIRVYTRPYFVDSDGMRNFEGFTITNSVQDVFNTQAEIHMLACLTAFDWAPYIYITSDGEGTQSETDAKLMCLPFGDFENYCVTSRDTICRMNDLAILSELATTSHTSI